MIETIKFQNFKLLRHAALSPGRFSLVVGPNGSGKSTLLQGIAAAAFQDNAYVKNKVIPGNIDYPSIASIGGEGNIWIQLYWKTASEHCLVNLEWVDQASEPKRKTIGMTNKPLTNDIIQKVDSRLASFQIFSLVPAAIAASASIQHSAELGRDGGGLPAVLDNLNDEHFERFQLLNDEVSSWLPEFDRIIFEKPRGVAGQKSIALRTRAGKHRIPANQLSDGTLFALALLTLAHLPDPPAFIGIEDVDRGIHPRMLSDVQKVLYRLAYPEEFGDTRQPVQVIATTHSPYLLDLYKSHPEQVIIARKQPNGAEFERLSERADSREILEGAPLGEVWYSGVLGG